jgi:cell division septal protein FtsQ
MDSSERPYTPANPPPRARGNPAAAKKKIPWVRLGFGISALGLVSLASVWGLQRLEQFFLRDPRFVLNGPADESPTLDIHGAVHAQRVALERVFAQDIGRSVYLVPLSARRDSLQKVDWVREASVARVWPNRIVAQVSERQPVAFVPLGPARLALIDDDGMILPAVTDRFKLPVLTGVTMEDAPAVRRDRVRRMLQLLRELGELGNRVSEIDVADRDNLKITQPAGDVLVTLVLGDRNFAGRMRNYYSHYSEIKQRLPDARTLDLRLEDRITVVE